jgi:hypothetical protein
MKMLIRMLRKETGQALPMALVLLFLGAAIIIPTLVFTSTNLKATLTIDQKTRDIYAADAGIDDGLWKVRYNYLPDDLVGEWTETTYDTYEENPYSYVMYDSDNPDDTVPINDRNVEVEIKPIWVLQGLEDPSLEQGRTPDGRLLTYGNLIDDGVYEVSLFHDGSLDPLEIQRIGCWLPPGFDYVAGSSNLEQGYGQPYYCVPETSSHNGGLSITWDYAGIDYDDLPAQGNKKIVTFQFTPDEDPTDAFCWSRTSRNDVHLSWDTAKKVFEISSTAPRPGDPEKKTTIVSHSIKKEFQALSGAISGDYQATGMTLMRDHDNDGGWWWDRDKRERLYKETWTNIPPTDPQTGDPLADPIPDDATVEKIFLYWSGWKCKPWNTLSLTQEQLNALPAQNHVNEVALKVKVGEVEMPRTKVTASDWQVMSNYLDGWWGPESHGWSYACFADITDVVTGYFKDHGGNFHGNALYTVGHWDISQTYSSSTYRYKLYNWKDNHQNEDTPPPPVYYARYPLGSPMDGGQNDHVGRYGYQYYYEDTGDQDELSYAAWSVIIIYSSPSTSGHHLYLFDQFLYCNTGETLDFTIKGFLAPDDVASDPNAARLTCFVGEGDYHYTGDNLLLNGHYLNGDSINPIDNVWNAKSNVLGGASTHEGIDIDTFTAGGGTVIQPGDTEAEVDIPTGTDCWNLVYIVLSFTSEITTGGVIDYKIE